MRTSKLEDCAQILDTFQHYGHNEIDTSRFYGVSPMPFAGQIVTNFTQGGSSEEYLKQLNWPDRKLIMDTKFFPNTMGYMGKPVEHLTPADMRKGLETSLEVLGTQKVDLWYLHAPDRSVPLEETLKGVNELFKEGKFERWGISNFMAWEGM